MNQYSIIPGPQLGFSVTGAGGIIASAEGTSLVVGSGGILRQKSFKFGGSETLFEYL